MVHPPAAHAGGESDVGCAWDGVRQQVVQTAVRDLLPQMEREARSKLAADARAAVVQQASDNLWQLASRAPLTVSSLAGLTVESGPGGKQAGAWPHTISARLFIAGQAGGRGG